MIAPRADSGMPGPDSPPSVSARRTNADGAAPAQADEATFKLVTLAEFDAFADLEPPGWLVDRLIPRVGTTLLVGAPRSGKSRLATSLAVHVGGGAPFAGRSVDRGPVVYLILEHAMSITRDNFTKAARAIGVDVRDALPVHLLARQRWLLDISEHVDWLREELDRLGAVLVVIDSLRPATTIDESRSNETRDVFRACDALAGGRRAVVLLHHTGKDGRPRGSTDVEAASGSVIEVKRARGSDLLALTLNHHGAPESRCALRWSDDDSGLRFAAVGDESDSGAGDLPLGAVTDVLRGARTGLSQHQLRVQLRTHLRRDRGAGASNDAIDALVREAEEVGLVEVVAGPRGAKITRLSPEALRRAEGSF